MTCRWAALALCLLLLGVAAPPGLAGPEPTPASRADEVVKAVAGGDDAALRALGASEHPEAWLVVDALLARGAGDAAARFAAAATAAGT
ncbi:MAG: hypothetical protein P1V36_10310, partial [Planctomycetota bacterium]|nr:hypothetical protein [Planctomycetota bacterium]